ncbi:hemerythrin domain-containing protein [Thiohalomonas denitrificans]|uniref:hemerythrin domain-containing protein n=1 Tax=Thiohalomonas denitrificans TaxID=415747 RepID=UPI0026E99987|nr:hemerythrin domain-containing protein [Thiohalomonas denitrificans]
MTEYAPAPGTGIRYSPELIEEFKNDHERFFALHRAIVATHQREDFFPIPSLMSEFEAALTGHLLIERVRLYAYMDAYFSVDQKTREMLRNYRTEMDRIGDSVMQLFRKYRNIDTEVALRQSFGRDFEELGKVLAERMQREESILYPLYMPVVT